jgi:hypothetical protein
MFINPLHVCSLDELRTACAAGQVRIDRIIGTISGHPFYAEKGKGPRTSSKWFFWLGPLGVGCAYPPHLTVDSADLFFVRATRSAAGLEG